MDPDEAEARRPSTALAPSHARTIVVDGVTIVPNHHRASSLERAEARLTPVESSSGHSLERSESGSSARGWFARVVGRATSPSLARHAAEGETGASGDDRVVAAETLVAKTAAAEAATETRGEAERDDAAITRGDEDEGEDEDDDEDAEESTPTASSSGASWFNPEQFTAEKRRWLKDRRSMSFDAYARTSGSEQPGSASAQSGPLKMMEAFLVCGLEPNAEVGVVADSAAKAREARLSGAREDSPIRITDPRKLRAYRGTAGETYKAAVLFQYPSEGEGAPTFAVEEVAAFCFPHGVEPRLLERTPSMSKLQEIMYGTSFDDGDDQVFVFQVQTSDNTPMYGVCAYVREVLQQAPPLVQHARGDAPATEFAQPPLSPGTPTKDGILRSSSPGPGLLKSRYIQVAPRCYCILSRVPFFRTHFQVLSHVLGMERVERIRQNLSDLLPEDDSSSRDGSAAAPISTDGETIAILKNYLALDVPSVGEESAEFTPSEGVKPIRYGRPTPSEIVSPVLGPMVSQISPEEEALHLEDWAVVSLCATLNLENVLSLLTAVLLEKQIVVFSNNLGELSAVSLALIPMLRPFRWQSLFLPILPQHMVDFLDAPVPFVCGVQHKTSDLRARTSNLCRINVYKDDVKIQWEDKPLRLPKMADLVRTLLPLHHAVVEASVNRKKRPVIDPSQSASEAARAFLRAWRAYLNSLVTGIRNHAISDVNEIDAKVAILLKESFLSTFAGRDRSFMRAFVETQMFSAYCDERLAQD